MRETAAVSGEKCGGDIRTTTTTWRQRRMRGVGGCELEVGDRLLRWSVERSSKVLLYVFVKCVKIA